MTKLLRVSMPDGSQWDVPFWRIADNMLQQDAARDGFDTAEDADILEWARENMTWDDVSKWAFLSRVHTDFMSEGWKRGEQEVVEK